MSSIAAVLLGSLASPARVGTTPPMGWNPYNHYGCGGTDADIREQTEALLALGLDKAGFRYMNLDCGWASGTRDPAGNVVPVPGKFPEGIKPLADYVHSKGLKFGIYTDIGTRTCGGGSGILGHEDQDAKAYASWTVDLVKNDDCHHADNTTAAYQATWEALVRTGRPMIHMTKDSLDVSSPLARSFAQARRVSKDITWLFGRIKSLVYQQQSWAGNLSNISGIQQLTGNGFWNDMDMMEIGNAGVGSYQGIWQNLSFAESRTHFALWSLLKSPMILGCDLRAQRPDIVNVLSNREATAFNQDPLGVQAALLESTQVQSNESYMLLKPCNTSEPRQLGWTMDPSGLIRTKADTCITAAHPMYEAVLLPCNRSDERQIWSYNETQGTLQTTVVYTDAQPTCLAGAFAHELRGNQVSVAICRSNGARWSVKPDGTMSSGVGDSTLPVASWRHRAGAMNKRGTRLAAPPTPGVGHPLAKTENCVMRVDASPLENALGIGAVQVYGGPLSGGAFGVGLANMDTVSARNITLDWSTLGLPRSKPMKVRAAWDHSDLGTFTGSFAMFVAPHDTALLRLSPIE